MDIGLWRNVEYPPIDPASATAIGEGSAINAHITTRRTTVILVFIVVITTCENCFVVDLGIVLFGDAENTRYTLDWSAGSSICSILMGAADIVSTNHHTTEILKRLSSITFKMKMKMKIMMMLRTGKRKTLTERNIKNYISLRECSIPLQLYVRLEVISEVVELVKCNDHHILSHETFFAA